MVTRWRHAFPQYRVGHLLRVSGIEAAVKRLPALAVAGSTYRAASASRPASWVAGRPPTPCAGLPKAPGSTRSRERRAGVG